MTFSLTTLATRGVASISEARAARATQKRLCAELDAILARHTTDELQELSQATGRAYAA